MHFDMLTSFPCLLSSLLGDMQGSFYSEAIRQFSMDGWNKVRLPRVLEWWSHWQFKGYRWHQRWVHAQQWLLVIDNDWGSGIIRVLSWACLTRESIVSVLNLSILVFSDLHSERHDQRWLSWSDFHQSRISFLSFLQKRYVFADVLSSSIIEEKKPPFCCFWFLSLKFEWCLFRLRHWQVRAVVCW